MNYKRKKTNIKNIFKKKKKIINLIQFNRAVRLIIKGLVHFKAFHFKVN